MEIIRHPAAGFQFALGGRLSLGRQRLKKPPAETGEL
jgi:hypothetical protein